MQVFRQLVARVREAEPARFDAVLKVDGEPTSLATGVDLAA